METVDKIIAALGVALVAALGAIGGLVVKLRRSGSDVKIIETSDGIRAAKAKQKRDHADVDFAIRSREELIERLSGRVTELESRVAAAQNEALEKYDSARQEHAQCREELAGVKAQLADIREWQKLREQRSV